MTEKAGLRCGIPDDFGRWRQALVLLQMGLGVSGNRKDVGESALEAVRPMEPLPFPAQWRTGVFHLP